MTSPFHFITISNGRQAMWHLTVPLKRHTVKYNQMILQQYLASLTQANGATRIALTHKTLQFNENRSLTGKWSLVFIYTHCTHAQSGEVSKKVGQTSCWRSIIIIVIMSCCCTNLKMSSFSKKPKSRRREKQAAGKIIVNQTHTAYRLFDAGAGNWTFFNHRVSYVFASFEKRNEQNYTPFLLNQLRLVLS